MNGFGFIPLPVAYCLALVTRTIGQGLDVVMDCRELGWLRYALAPLNVPEDHLPGHAHALRAAEVMCRLLSRERKPTRTERIAHITVAGYLALNGYRLEIPVSKAGEYRELMGLIRTSAADVEQVARYLAAHITRRSDYVEPNVELPCGSILMTASSATPESVERWFGRLRDAVSDAGLRVGLDLKLRCPSRIRPADASLVTEHCKVGFEEADGQIVVGFTSESTAGGYAQVILGFGRPSAWLEVGGAGAALSVQAWQEITRGAIFSVENPEEAAKVVEEWIARDAQRLHLAIYHRLTARFFSYRVHLEMSNRWNAEGLDREWIAHSTGISEDVIDHILKTPALFARMPLETLDAIASSLGIAFDTAMAAVPMGLLEDEEELALKSYVKRGLSGDEALELRMHGARLSGVERTRLGLSTPEGWEMFHDGLQTRR